MSSLIDIVHASDLPEEDKELWVSLIDTMSADQLEVLVEYIGNNKDGLLFLTENLKAKQKAFADNDSDAIFQILNDEKIAE